MVLQTGDVPVALLAGGLATRLGGLTGSVPKALLDVAGRPFVDHQLSLLHRHGIRRVVFCVGHLGEQIEDYLGAGTDRLPRYRSFAIGGRGTLVGEPFRAYGGRTVALAHLEWRFEVPAPAIGLGSFVSTGRHLTVAPFVAAGYAGRPIPTLPWSRSDGVRPVAGVAFEWFMRLIRVEAGVGLRDGHVGVTLDINRDWWGLL